MRVFSFLVLGLKRLFILVACMLVFGLCLGVQAQGEEPIYTIPVVVHLAYYPDGPIEQNLGNLTDCHVHKAIEELNKCFSQTHGLDIPEVFQSVAAGDTRIRFELATRDPNGNPTTGIIRHPVVGSLAEVVEATPVVDPDDPIADVYPINDAVGPWHTGKYLNIYLYTLQVTSIVTVGVRPRAGFHENNNGRDFVIVTSQEFSPLPPHRAGYDLSRTLVRSVGNYLSLRALVGSCDGIGDLCSDIPEMFSFSTKTRRCDDNFVCDPSGTRAMVENYMDFSRDACQRLFTLCQKEKMRTALTTFRFNLYGDGNRALDGDPTAIDLTIYKEFQKSRQPADFLDPTTARFRVPTLFVANQGQTTVNSLTLGFAIDGEEVARHNVEQNFSFCDVASLDMPSSIQNILAATPTNDGREHVLTIWVEATGDTDRTNDTIEVRVSSPHTLTVTTMPEIITDLPAAGGEVEINIDIGGASTGWRILGNFEVEPSLGTADATATFTYRSNPGIASRSGTMNIVTTGMGTTATRTLNFSQAPISTAHELTITTTPTTLSTLPATSGVVMANINIGGFTESWHASTNSNFFSISPSAGSRDGVMTIRYNANRGSSNRTSEIIIKTRGTHGTPIVSRLTLTQVSLLALGIGEEIDAAASSVRLFPNPSGGEVFLDIEVPKKQEIQVSFFSTSGNLGYSRFFEVMPNNDYIAFSPKVAKDALYFVHIKGETLDEIKRLVMR